MTDTTITRVALFVVSFAAMQAAHYVADHWLQTDHQAAAKGDANWRGRWACASHVGVYVFAQAVALYAAAGWLGLHLAPGWTAAGLGVSAVTHYVADRRWPLRWLAERSAPARFFHVKGGGINGAYLLDQSWHLGWIFVAALVVAGA